MQNIKIASINHNQNNGERLDLYLTEINNEVRIIAIDELGEEEMLAEAFPSITAAFEGVEMMYGSDGAGVWGLTWADTLEYITYPIHIEQSAASGGKTSIIIATWVENNSPIKENGDHYYAGDHDARAVEKIDNLKELLDVASDKTHWAYWDARKLLRGEKVN